MRLLIIENNEDLIGKISAGLSGKYKEIKFVNSCEEAVIESGRERFDVIISDASLITECSIAKKLKQLRVDTEVIVLIPGEISVKSIVALIKEGVYDCLDYPWNFDYLKTIIDRAYEKSMFKSAIISRETGNSLIGQSEQMKSINRLIIKVADSSLPVLIEGESGTGKEVAATALHKNSSRAKNAFIPLNCGALPKDLLENELFGHEAGAFTGATSVKRGLFEIADGGTLFIDEIGEMDPMSQVKLLRVLETGEFRRLGGTKQIKANVRVVAATNKVLEKEIEKGRFRMDLYYRLNALRVFLPSLRNRKDDIPLFVNHFIGRVNTSPVKKTVAGDAMKALISFKWPGNVRELFNVVQSAVVMSGDRREIILKDLPAYIAEPECDPGSGEQDGCMEDISMAKAVEQAEKKYLKGMLDKYGNNKKKMAGIIKISRAKLYRKLKEYGLM